MFTMDEHQPPFLCCIQYFFNSDRLIPLLVFAMLPLLQGNDLNVSQEGIGETGFRDFLQEFIVSLVSSYALPP